MFEAFLLETGIVLKMKEECSVFSVTVITERSAAEQVRLCKHSQYVSSYAQCYKQIIHPSWIAPVSSVHGMLHEV